MLYQTLDHPPIKLEDVYMMTPHQGTNISVMQPGIPDQMVNYTPIVHTIPAQGEGYIYDVDSAAPLLIFTPITSVNTSQISTNEDTPAASVIEIPLQNEVTNEVSLIYLVGFFRVKYLYQQLTNKYQVISAPYLIFTKKSGMNAYF